MLTTDPRQTQRNYRNNDGVSLNRPVCALTTPDCMLGAVYWGGVGGCRRDANASMVSSPRQDATKLEVCKYV